MLHPVIKFYLLGALFTAFVVAGVHLYSYLFESPFRCSEWPNILKTVLIGGVGFGIAIWSLSQLRKPS